AACGAWVARSPRLPSPADALVLDLLLEPGVADQNGVLAGQDEVTRLAGEPGEVGYVHRAGDQDGVDLVLLEVPGQGLPTLCEVVHTGVCMGPPKGWWVNLPQSYHTCRAASIRKGVDGTFSVLTSYHV